MCALVTGVQTCALPILLLGSGMTRIGSHATSAAPAALAAVADVLNGAGLPTVVMDDIYAFVWAKLGAAGTMSSISALTRLRIGPNSDSPAGVRLIERMMGEIVAEIGRASCRESVCQYV